MPDMHNLGARDSDGGRAGAATTTRGCGGTALLARRQRTSGRVWNILVKDCQPPTLRPAVGGYRPVGLILPRPPPRGLRP
jgi:hypothetical protein